MWLCCYYYDSEILRRKVALTLIQTAYGAINNELKQGCNLGLKPKSWNLGNTSVVYRPSSF